MKRSICHYSFHRTLKEKGWSCSDFAQNVKKLGIEGIDFHSLYLGSPYESIQSIKSALSLTGLEMSGLSISNNFNKDPDSLKNEIGHVIDWMRTAAEVEAPVCRIFGGHILDRTSDTLLAEAFTKIIDCLSVVTKEAEKLGVTLALENHGGLPCTAQEQASVIEKINSKNLLATIDVGNYMQGGQEGHHGTAIVSKYAAYVHFKDFKKKVSKKNPWGWEIEPCILGEGDVNHLLCLKELQKVCYSGFVALEYEGIEEESIAVPRSVEVMANLMQNVKQSSKVKEVF